MRSGGARKIEKGRQKGVDELDPYVKVTLGPFGRKKETKALKDGGRDPDFLAVHGNELRFEVPSHMPVATGEPVQVRAREATLGATPCRSRARHTRHRSATDPHSPESRALDSTGRHSRTSSCSLWSRSLSHRSRATDRRAK